MRCMGTMEETIFGRVGVSYVYSLTPAVDRRLLLWADQIWPKYKL